MNFKFEYLRENEFLSKTILACLSGAQMGSIHEKNRVRKSRDTASLMISTSTGTYFYTLIKILGRIVTTLHKAESGSTVWTAVSSVGEF